MQRYCAHFQYSLVDRLSCVLLLAVSTYLLEVCYGSENFPLHRPLENLREAALQTVGRDGPRYPDEGFSAIVRRYRALHLPSSGTNKIHYNGDGEPSSPDDCVDSYAVLTLANSLGMEALVPLLLESLHRIDIPHDSGESRQLARHALVVGVTNEALQACIRLRRRYKNACLGDDLSGLYEGDNRYPDFKFLAYGMAKLKYIVNVLSTGTSVLYVDADVIFLRNPFPDLLASGADIAVATALAPCGTRPSKPNWTYLDATEDSEMNASVNASASIQQQQQDGRSLKRDGGDKDADAASAADVRGYAPGITFYRSKPGVMRCTYSLVVDMMNVARKNANATVLEQEHFAAFMPFCTEVLGLQLTELEPPEYLTSCGSNITQQVQNSGSPGVVAVHVSGTPGSSLLDGQPVMESLIAIKAKDIVHAAANNEELL